MSADDEYLTVRQVADFVGLKPRSVEMALYRGSMPEPDMVVFGRNLWLRDTIVKWRKTRYKRRKFKHRKDRLKTPGTDGLPKNLRVAGAAKNRIDERPAVEAMSGDVAKVIAAALRSEGHYCTVRDVQELAVADPEALDYDRRKLQQRVLRKVRGIKQRGKPL